MAKNEPPKNNDSWKKPVQKSAEHQRAAESQTPKSPPREENSKTEVKE